MKKLIVFLLLMSNVIVAQINFEKGYFIDNNNLKTECLIKYEDWKNNPEKIALKTDLNSDLIIKTTSEIKEFGILGVVKYQRFEVNIDFSSENFNKISEKREPEWVKKNVFLKIIVDSKFKLFEFKNEDIKRYFASIDDLIPEQLVFKKFYFTGRDEYNLDTSGYRENNYYKQQLKEKYKCEVTPDNKIKNVEYNFSSLKKYFTEINRCSGSLVEEINKNQTKSKFNFKLKTGVSSNSFFIDTHVNSDSFYNKDVQFENKNLLKIGGEFEYVLPYNKNKWAVFLEPIYQTTYSSEKKNIYNFSPTIQVVDDWKVKNSNLNISIGVRYYMFLNKESKIFLGAAFGMNSNFNSEIIRNDDKNYFLFENKTNFSFRLGYTYKKVALELILNNKNLLKDYLDTNSKYKDVSLLLSYTIFSSKG